MEPREPSFRTFANLPVAGAPGQKNAAIRIATAGDEPARVLIRCLSGTVIVSYDAAELNTAGQTPMGGVYRIPAGNADPIVMNPRQELFAAAVTGPATAISVAISDAYPIKTNSGK